MILSPGCVHENHEDKSMYSDQQPPVVETQSAETFSQSTSTIEENYSHKTPCPVVSPPYNEITKNELIIRAKKEIIRIFPNVEENSLNGKWVDQEYAGVILLTDPFIEFENVNDTSPEYMSSEIVKSRGIPSKIKNNIVTIRVDPKSGHIILYKSSVGYHYPLKEQERIVSHEETEDHALGFLRKIYGDTFVTEIKNKYLIYNCDRDGDDGSGRSYIYFFNTKNGVRYLNDQIIIKYDRIIDAVSFYSSRLKDPEILDKATLLSPEPDITLREAKKIFESKLNEKYPDEELGIMYQSDALTHNRGELVWLDMSDKDMDESKRVNLAWNIYFNDKDMRDENSQMVKQVIIDAHTGDILLLFHRDFEISKYLDDK